MINVRRSEKPPDSLTSTQEHNSPDVLEQLDIDFAGKCYLCEGKGATQVDHLRPKAGFPELRQDWTNLFLAHADRCNQRRIRWSNDQRATRKGKPVNWPDGGMLDCASQSDDVEARLLQWFEPTVGDLNVYITARNDDDRAARNTAEELTYIHMNRRSVASHRPSPRGARHARKLRDDIRAQWDAVVKALGEVMKAALDGEGEQRRRAVAEFRARVARDAPFCALIRGTLERGEWIPQALRAQLGFD